MKDEELEQLKAELKQFSGQLLYKTMPGHAERVERHQALVEQIRAEEEQRASLSGMPLVERQLCDTREMIEETRKMAVATAEAARWAKWAAFGTFAAAVIAAVQTCRAGR